MKLYVNEQLNLKKVFEGWSYWPRMPDPVIEILRSNEMDWIRVLWKPAFDQEVVWKKIRSSPSVHSLHHPHTFQEDPLRDIVIIIIIKISPVLLCYVCVWVWTRESHPCRFCRWTTGRVEPWRAGTLCYSDEWCCPERVALRACLVQFGHIGYPVQWETLTHLYATNTCGL